MDNITVRTDRIVDNIVNFWNHLHFHPTDAVEDAWGKEILDRIAKDCAADYIRLYTMFEDLVVQQKDGTIIFCWEELDRRLDYMTQRNFRLLLCFNFMPPCLAQDSDSVSWLRSKNKRFCSSSPRDYRQWGKLCEALTSHVLERYGKNVVRSWRFQCWNEPDQIYWLGGKFFTENTSNIDQKRAEEYCRLFDYFENGVHRVDDQIPVGGPSVAVSDNFFKTFLKHCTSGVNHVSKRNGTRLDFVSVHAYSEYPYSGQINHDMVSPDNIVRRLNVLHKTMDECGCSAIPMIMDEWGGATKGFCGLEEDPIMLFRETEYFSAFYACLIDLLSKAKHLKLQQMMLCLSGQDYLTSEFDGRRTLFTLNGYPKAIYNGFLLAAKLGEKRLAFNIPPNCRGGIIPTRTADGKIVIMLYHFTADLNAVPSDWHFRLCCQGLRGKYRLRTYLIDRTHSNSYSTWAMLRCPEHPTIRERGMIHQAGKVLPLFGEELIDTNNEWSQEMILGHNSICLFELFPQSEHVECKEI